MTDQEIIEYLEESIGLEDTKVELLKIPHEFATYIRVMFYVGWKARYLSAKLESSRDIGYVMMVLNHIVDRIALDIEKEERCHGMNSDAPSAMSTKSLTSESLREMIQYTAQYAENPCRDL